LLENADVTPIFDTGGEQTRETGSTNLTHLDGVLVGTMKN